MELDVTVVEVPERPTAVIAETTTWADWPQLWPVLLDEVWREVRARPDVKPGRNVMLYRDEVPNVEAGVEVAEPFARAGRVVASSLPAGRVATATLRGPYERIGAAHDAVIRACDVRGLQRLGPRWEVYGHWDESAPAPEVEVFWLVT
jgi:effector-binding domain-containing protein